MINNKKGQSEIIIIGLVILFLCCPLWIGYIFPDMKFIHTTINGEHTGYITASETNGILYKENKLYFKTDTQSTQEDTYCFPIELIDQVKAYQENKTRVTITYQDYFIIGANSCSPVITGIK